MKTIIKIATMSQKGGTGKTNAGVNLVVAAQLAGHTAALIDLDPQATAAKWGDRREEDSLLVFSAHANRLQETIYAAEQNGATFIVIDTQGSTDTSLVKIAKACDMVLIPCSPSVFDAEAIESTIIATSMAKTPAHIFFNAVDSRSSLIDETKNAVEVYDVPCAPCMLGDRVAFKRSVIYGLGVQEFEPSGKAAREVKALYKYVSNSLEV